jgi:hypothetical protein
MNIPDVARTVLEEGTLCYLAAPSLQGPHVTPVVYVLDGGRLWGTTGRGTTKARRWRSEPVAGGLVRRGEQAVTFRGAVALYDVLDPDTWADSLVRAPLVARASARFTLKNARFFAGYARDVGSVPLAWTPPARVIFSVDIDAGAVLEGDGRISERWGRWGRAVRSADAYRTVSGSFPYGDLPEQVCRLLGLKGTGMLALDGTAGPVVLPSRWSRNSGVYHAVLPRTILALASPRAEGRASLVVDRASSWRAARMRGVLLRGAAQLFVPDRVRTGHQDLRARIAAAGSPPEDPAVIRLRASTAVWWQGWASGTVRRR